MKRVSSLLLLVVLVSAFSGCTKESSALTLVSESGFTVANQGTAALTPTPKQTKVLSTLQDYAAELAKYTNDPPLAIDFTPGRYLLVDMGQRSSSGYSIAVTSVDVGADSVTANVRLIKPGTNCVLAPVMTNPYQFVFIPSVKEVLVSESVVVVNC